MKEGVAQGDGAFIIIRSDVENTESRMLAAQL